MAYNGQTKYLDTMPAQLIAMFTEGKDRAHFCAHHSIANATFDIWLDKNPEFKEAYTIAQQKAKRWFLDVAQNHLIQEHDGAKLDSKLWSMLMRNRFEMTEHRKLKIEGLKIAKNFQEQMQSILDELAKGNLTASEAQQLSKLVETGVAIHEHTELEKRVGEIEKANRIGLHDGEFKEEG